MSRKGVDSVVPFESIIQIFPIWSTTNNLLIPSRASTTVSGDTKLSPTTRRSTDTDAVAFSALVELVLLFGFTSTFLQLWVRANDANSSNSKPGNELRLSHVLFPKPLSFVKDFVFISYNLNVMKK